MALIDSVVVFAIGLLIGGLGIHFSAKLLGVGSSLKNAIVTALLGAIAWSLAGYFLTGIPLIGPFATYLAWLFVINMRYPGGWIDAAAVALFSWLMTAAILYVMATLGIGTFDAIGIPRM